MRDVTIWLLAAEVLAVAMLVWRGMIRSSLGPARIPSRVTHGAQCRSR